MDDKIKKKFIQWLGNNYLEVKKSEEPDRLMLDSHACIFRASVLPQEFKNALRASPLEAYEKLGCLYTDSEDIEGAYAVAVAFVKSL